MIDPFRQSRQEVCHLVKTLHLAIRDNPIIHILHVADACVVDCAHQMGLVEERRTRRLADLAKTDHAIDARVFSSILDLDDNEDQDFSWSLVSEFIDLAKKTLDEMDACL